MEAIAEGLAEFQEVSEQLLRDLGHYLNPYGAVLGDARFEEGFEELVAGM